MAISHYFKRLTAIEATLGNRLAPGSFYQAARFLGCLIFFRIDHVARLKPGVLTFFLDESIFFDRRIQNELFRTLCRAEGY